MKKVFAMLLVMAMCLSLSACGGNDGSDKGDSEVTLTTDNLEDYLKIAAKVEECTFDEGGLGYLGAKGDAEIVIETVNNSGASFKNVTVKLEITAKGGLRCGWEFAKDNLRCEEEHKQEYNSKIITIELSHDGEESVTEKLKWVNYKGQWSDSGVVYDELDDSDLDITILEVTGTARAND